MDSTAASQESEIDTDKNCFVCENALAREGLWQLSSKNAFASFCNLFRFSSSFQSQWQTRSNNFGFCLSCESQLEEATEACEQIQLLQTKVNQIRANLQECMISSYMKGKSHNGSGNNAELNLKQMIAQCISPCRVLITRLPDDHPDVCLKRQRARRKSCSVAKVDCEDDSGDFDAQPWQSGGDSPILQSSVEVDEEIVSDQEEVPDPDFTCVEVEFSDSSSLAEEIAPTVTIKEPRKKKRKKLSTESACPADFSCKYCKKKFFAWKVQRRHLLEVHNEDIVNSCQYCGLNFDTECRIPQEEGAPTPEHPYKCNAPNCTRTYKLLVQLRKHHYFKCLERPATRKVLEANNVCSYCGNKYKRLRELRHHIDTVHEKVFKLYCELCGTGFQTTSSLTRHKTYVHSEEKRFECDICKRRFKRPHQLKDHQLKHSGKRPFMCELCGKDFPTKSNLTWHTTNVHSEQVFPCTECGKIFMSKNYAYKHYVSAHLGKKTVRRKKAKGGGLVETLQVGTALQTEPLKDAKEPTE